MTKAGWVTGTDNYFNRVTKARIIEAVREVKGDKIAEQLADHKKKDMALEAERLLAGTGWLPECLRTSVFLDGAANAALPGRFRRDRTHGRRMSIQVSSSTFEERE